ncbi:PWI domain [Macleaya cordata]|uniref:PWI domain n=1 Tax=Macleaya cordata TaxID=56857 RepID=A0A200R025_MACCD|nr:PWI domain [Macleaya cordata]
MALKQLVDSISNTIEELLSYDINWGVYDKHEVQQRMRRWIYKKIIEIFEDNILQEDPYFSNVVDYIVSATKDHHVRVRSSRMLEILNDIFFLLDDETELFMMKMWRFLIFEIKRAEAASL